LGRLAKKTAAKEARAGVARGRKAAHWGADGRRAPAAVRGCAFGLSRAALGWAAPTSREGPLPCPAPPAGCRRGLGGGKGGLRAAPGGALVGRGRDRDLTRGPRGRPGARLFFGNGRVGKCGFRIFKRVPWAPPARMCRPAKGGRRPRGRKGGGAPRQGELIFFFRAQGLLSGSEGRAPPDHRTEQPGAGGGGGGGGGSVPRDLIGKKNPGDLLPQQLGRMPRAILVWFAEGVVGKTRIWVFIGKD